ncbi:MAG: hypothetical protein C9356_11730 [Oleiphilus sp.]|nr:MAG: hypothetical protein C9356_11730 [Oleiphilus sp.]
MKDRSANPLPPVELFNPSNGLAIRVHQDRRIERSGPDTEGWQRYRRIRPDMPIDQFIARQRNNGFRDLVAGDIPRFEEVLAMDTNGVACATDGCEGIEPDGACSHGAPAWPNAMLRMAGSVS